MFFTKLRAIATGAVGAAGTADAAVSGSNAAVSAGNDKGLLSQHEMIRNLGTKERCPVVEMSGR